MKADDIVLEGIYLGRTFSPRQVIGFDTGPKGAKRVQYFILGRKYDVLISENYQKRWSEYFKTKLDAGDW